MGDISKAEEVLLQFDTEFKAAAEGRGAKGLGGAISGNEWAIKINSSNRRYELAGAVKQLSDASVAAEGGVILSVFAGSPAAGVEALRSWVEALGLPAFDLEGLDADGITFVRADESGENVPLDMDGFGATLLMYHSNQNGKTTLMSYGGDFRGVAINTDLRDGVYRQYGYLPLQLHDPERQESPFNPFSESVPASSAYDNGRAGDEFSARPDPNNRFDTVRPNQGEFAASSERGDMVPYKDESQLAGRDQERYDSLYEDDQGGDYNPRYGDEGRFRYDGERSARQRGRAPPSVYEDDVDEAPPRRFYEDDEEEPAPAPQRRGGAPQRRGDAKNTEPWDEEDDDGNWWTRPRRRPEERCDWRRRALQAEGGTAALLSDGLSSDEAWLREWQDRFGCWWIALPLPTQGELGGCMAALGLHISSRLNAVLGKPPHAQPLLGTEPRCEALGGLTHGELVLPDFPEFPAEFRLPPLPRLVPSWEQLRLVQSTQPRQGGQLHTAAPVQAWQAAAVAGTGAGAGVAFVALAALLFTRRRPQCDATTQQGRQSGSGLMSV